MPQNPLDPLLKKPDTAPIRRAYGPGIPNPEKPSDPIGDFLGGFTGFGQGMTDENPSNASFLGDALGNLNPEKLLLAPISGITKFIKPLVQGGKVTRVPDTARRVLKTEENLTNLEKLLRSTNASEEDVQAALAIHRKYPRTTAHINQFGTLDRPVLGNMNFSRVEGIVDQNKYLMDVSINPQMMDLGFGHGRLPYANTLAHELQHVGQALPNPKEFKDRYLDYNEIAGYQDNPFEIKARESGVKRVQEVSPRDFPPGVKSSVSHDRIESDKPFTRTIQHKLGHNRYQQLNQELDSKTGKYVTKSTKMSTKPMEIQNPEDRYGKIPPRTWGDQVPEPEFMKKDSLTLPSGERIYRKGESFESRPDDKKLSEAFGKSPKVISDYYKDTIKEANVKKQLMNSLEAQKKSKGKKFFEK